MDKATHAVVAKELLAARRSREPIDPVSRTHPGLTVDDAYAIQLEQVRTWTEDEQRVQGHKVGLTSAAMQRQLGVDQPDYGHLMESMFHLEGLPIGLDEFISPKVEPEIAFVLKRPLTGPGVNAAQALSAVDYVLPALEIIDSRIRDWKIGLIDTVADNASAAWRGARQPPRPGGCGRSAAVRLRTDPARRGRRDRCRGRCTRLAAERPGLAGQHGGSARRNPGAGPCHPARLGLRRRARRRW